MQTREIPLYSHEGTLVQWITPKRLERLQSLGRVRVVTKRGGRLARAILHRMPGEPRPIGLSSYSGTRYSFLQHLDDGHHCWRLRSLGDRPSETELAPAEVRSVFLQVLMDCRRVVEQQVEAP